MAPSSQELEPPQNPGRFSLITDAEIDVLRAYLRLVEDGSVPQHKIGDPIPLVTCLSTEQVKSGNCLPTKELLIELLGRAPPLKPDPNALIKGIHRKHALVIGIDKYQGGIPPLQNAVRDAKRMASILGDKLGYRVKLLTDSTKSKVVKEFNALAANAGVNDSVLVYFAGHGAVASPSEKSDLGDGFWLLQDTEITRPDSLLANSDVKKLMQIIKAKQVALISDSCFSGKFIDSERSQIAAMPPPDDPSTLLGKRAVVVMTAGRNEPVSESGGNGNSVFTSKLLEALNAASTWLRGAAVHQGVANAVANGPGQRPKYAGIPTAGHQSGAEYFFEVRSLK